MTRGNERYLGFIQGNASKGNGPFETLNLELRASKRLIPHFPKITTGIE